MTKMASEDFSSVSTKDVTELIEIVTKLMEEYNKQISQVNKYYRTLYELQILQTLSITSTSSIPQ